MLPEAASCAGVVKIYWTETGEVHALKGIGCMFPRGAVTAVVGPSGSGKSSLLRILAGLDRPTAGSVRIEGKDLVPMTREELRRLRRRSVGYVFQRPSDNLVPYLTVRQHLELAGSLRGRRDGGGDTLLAQLGLDRLRDRLPHQLSGGEQQRVAFAQAVVGGPAVVIADEPTAELDSASGRGLLELLSALARERMAAFVVATHDPEVVGLADRTLYLRHGALEAEMAEDRTLSVIDDAGRIQLPQDALGLFPDRRAVVRVEDGEVRITPP